MCIRDSPETIDQFKGYYYEEQGYTVADSTDEFIKIGSRIYESVAHNIYSELSPQGRYRIIPEPYYDGDIQPEFGKETTQKIKTKSPKIDSSLNIEFC